MSNIMEGFGVKYSVRLGVKNYRGFELEVLKMENLGIANNRGFGCSE